MYEDMAIWTVHASVRVSDSRILGCGGEQDSWAE